MTILIRQGTNIWTAIAVAFALASSAAFIVHKFVEVPSHYLGRQLANKLRKTTAKSIAGDRNSTDGERRAQATLTVEGLS